MTTTVKQRVLTIMGSGETTPTMTGVHRSLFARSAGSNVLLDTPYGFQENADDITARTLDYFDRSARADVEVASLRRAADDAVRIASALAAVRDASWVFAGPGSPSYALAQWAATNIGPVLAEKLATGGIVVMSSAAALTVGTHAVPVYEIYKCGAAPHWLAGLDLLSPFGLSAAVIPHFDNAEGGNHDTRYCYLGERRLVAMEQLLPAGIFVLGVDEHTACVLDLATDTFTVEGKGGVTIRSGGFVTARIGAGEGGPIDDLRAAGSGRSTSGGSRPLSASAPVAVCEATTAGPNVEVVLAAAMSAEESVRAAVERRSVDDALSAVLDLDTTLEEWKGDTSTTDNRDRARAIHRSLIVRIGALATTGARDPREVLGPYVQIALDARTDARARKDWAASDAIRDALGAAGVEVRDTPSGQEWLLTDG